MTHEEVKRVLQEKIELRRLERTLAELERVSLSPQQAVRKALDEYLTRVIGGRMAVEECRAELTRQFAGNEKVLRDIEEALDTFAEQHLRDPSL